MIAVSNADRVVFPAIGLTKGDVVAYYERIAPRALPHVVERPLSIRRYPKGLAGVGFFQKNVPPHYPESIGRLAIPRSEAATRMHPRKGAKKTAAKKATAKKTTGKKAAAATAEPQDFTIYPIVRDAEHLAYLANQGAIELHVPTTRASDLEHPDRLIIDLDPPERAVALVRRAALLTRDALGEMGLETVPVATGSKGYHVVAAILPTVSAATMGATLQKVGALLAAKFPEELTTTFRISLRGERVFVDWLRNRQGATVIAPYSLRARPRASVATPLAWEEIESTAPDAFTIDDVDRLLERPDSLAELASRAVDAAPFVSRVDAAFESAGLVLETFDRFRS